MMQLIRRHPVWSFYILAFGIASVVAAGRYWLALRYFEGSGKPANYYAIVWDVQEKLGISNINVLSLARMSFEDPAILLSFFYAGAPTIAAIIIVFLIARRAGLRELFSRFKPWREGVSAAEGLRAYGSLTSVFLAFCLYFVLMSWAYGGEAGWEEIRPRIGSSIWIFSLYFLIGAFLREGGLLEELGWRGFALPRLIETMGSPLNASILIGIMWSTWHIPRDAGTYMISLPFGEYLLFLAMFTVALIGLSIIITYFYNRTGGSVIPAIMVHCLYVHMSSGLAYETLAWNDYGDFRSWLTVLLAFVILWIAGPELGRRNDEA